MFWYIGILNGLMSNLPKSNTSSSVLLITEMKSQTNITAIHQSFLLETSIHFLVTWFALLQFSFKTFLCKSYDKHDKLIEFSVLQVYKHLTSSEERNEPDLNLYSLYASFGGEPPFTNYTPDFTGTLDYIFVSENSELKPVGLLEIPGPDSPELSGGLPNSSYPSDHLPIGADFEVCTSSKPL